MCADDVFRRRRPLADAMLEDEAAVELGQLVGRHASSLPHADPCCKAIHGLAGRERALDDRATVAHALLDAGADLDVRAVACDADDVLDRQGRAGDRDAHERIVSRTVAVSLTVVGSINLDLVARTERLPRPGETVTDATFSRVPGGKGANQAVAAARMGAEVQLIGAVGNDELAGPALAELIAAGVKLDRLKRVDVPTGVALIAVDAHGENAIVVAPGANLELRPEDIGELPDCDGVLCQLEIPIETVEAAADAASGDFFLNAAPAREHYPLADVTIVNRYEVETLPDRDGVVIVTMGSEGAVLLDGGEEVARATPPHVEAVDGTGAGDAFTGCLVVSLLEGRPREEALRRAVIAGALSASRFGAQPSMPTAEEVDALL